MGSVKGLEGALQDVTETHPSLELKVDVKENGNVHVDTSGYKISDLFGYTGLDGYKPYFLDFAWFLTEETETNWAYTPYPTLRMGGTFKDDEGRVIEMMFAGMGGGAYNWSVSNYNPLGKNDKTKPMLSDEFKPLMEKYVQHLGAEVTSNETPTDSRLSSSGKKPYFPALRQLFKDLLKR